MYFIERAFKYLKNKKGKTLLLGIIFLVIANFVLAGLLVHNASIKAQEQTRISIGADVHYSWNWDGVIQDIQRGVISRELISNLKGQSIISSDILTEGGAPTYKNIMKVVDSQYVDYYDLGLVFNVASRDLTEYTLDTDNPTNGIFQLKLFNIPEPKVFKDGDAELKDGRFATNDEINNGANVVLIEENVAQLNNLKIGDSIPVTVSILDTENVAMNYEIIGIYKSNEAVGQDAFKGQSSGLPQNKLYIPFMNLKTIGLTDGEIDNLLITSNVISLKDPLDTDAFKAEGESKLDIKYGNLDANDALYNSLIGPIESLGSISKILVIIIAVAGALIIGLITALTINERKEEIGILLAIGENKMKIVSQFVLEVTLIALIAFALSSFTGSYLGNNISESVLDTEFFENQATEDYGRLGKGIGKGIGKGDNKDITNIEDNAAMDISLNTSVMLQLFGLGILLSVLSTIIPSMYVMRFNPKQILTNRNS